MKHFYFVPKTFILPQEMNKLAEEMNKKKSVWWIAKPSGSSQGKGIIITNNINDVRTPCARSR